MSLAQELIRQKYPVANRVAEHLKQHFGLQGRKGYVFLHQTGLIIAQIPYNTTIPSKDFWRMGGEVHMWLKNKDKDLVMKKWELISFIPKSNRKFGTDSFVEVVIDVGDDQVKGY